MTAKFLSRGSTQVTFTKIILHIAAKIYKEAMTCGRNLKIFLDLRRGELDLLSGGAPCQAFSFML